MRSDYSTFDIQKILGIPRERFRQWIEEGYIVPSVPARGAGTRASFTRMDVYRIALFDYLIFHGLKRSTAALIAKGLADEHAGSKYILVRRDWDSPPRISMVALSSPVWRFDMENGTFYHADDNDLKEPGFRPIQDWSDIYIINFEQIQTRVDKHINK